MKKKPYKIEFENQLKNGTLYAVCLRFDSDITHTNTNLKYNYKSEKVHVYAYRFVECSPHVMIATESQIIRARDSFFSPFLDVAVVVVKTSSARYSHYFGRRELALDEKLQCDAISSSHCETKIARVPPFYIHPALPKTTMCGLRFSFIFFFFKFFIRFLLYTRFAAEITIIYLN